MDITPYVERLRGDLTAAAEAGGAEARQAGERLALALDPAVRLALMDALSQAAAEITSELPAGSVEVRLRGREPQFVLDVPLAAPSAPPPSPPTPGADEGEAEEDTGTARITLRIPESLKARAEALAVKSERSLNTWIVNVVRAATRERAVEVDLDVSSLRLFDDDRGPPRRGSGRRISGWV